MFFMLILLFLREISGATFVNIYENENHWLSCSNTSADQKESRWWLGKDCSSLVQFEPMPCDPSSQCPAGKNPTSRYINCTQRNVSIAAFPGGGIFACKALSGSNASDPHPLINKEDHCRNFNFFIVAIINNTVESNMQSEVLVVVEGEQSFSLPCEFDLTGARDIFTLYWIKETFERRCLASVSNEDHWFSNDLNCCVGTKIKKRQVKNLTDPLDRHQSHYLTIFNTTTSDTGVYFCLVAVYTNRHMWKIVNNVTVQVRKGNSEGSTFTKELQISLGVVGGIVLISGIILFLSWKKKSKGKAYESQQRDQTTTEMEEECSPYAVSSCNDIDGNEVVYSLAMSPGVNPDSLYSLPESKSDPGMQPGENVQAIYAVPKKERS
ncbi:uncharacterized protein LOC128401661 isoform X1 [Podarcis raffonei]|uniref:uncharacterized protein LOC128401661 isoform X1 n=2 Tax=Podarcis raffonei TaxID=65483 RepID=UPI0023290425|nr:uncharacterized protein LOC128401661 isoform X1 [Podarcis raffonei]